MDHSVLLLLLLLLLLGGERRAGRLPWDDMLVGQLQVMDHRVVLVDDNLPSRQEWSRCDDRLSAEAGERLPRLALGENLRHLVRSP
jgi:hypothetical protein